MSGSWSEASAAGVRFDRPESLVEVEALTDAADLVQLQDTERALVASVYRRRVLGNGALGLEAAAGGVVGAYRDRGPVEVERSEGDPARWRTSFAALGSQASRVEVVVVRTSTSDATVVELAHPLALDDDDRPVVATIVSSIELA